MSTQIICRDGAGCYRVVRYSATNARTGESARYATMEDADALRAWLDERAAGYPRLAKFEGGKSWPVGGYDADELWRAPGHMPPSGLVEPNDVSNL